MASLGMPETSTTATATPLASNASSGVSGFAFTRQDVLDAAEDLLARLPEAKAVEPTGRVTGFGIQSDRDGKTINSLMIATNKCAGFPRPAGSIVVVTYFDHQAHDSWEGYCIDRQIEYDASETPHFVAFAEPHGRYKGMVNEEDPACHAYLKDVYFAFLEGLADRGDVGLLVADGFGDFAEETMNECTLFEAGASSTSELSPSDWMPRRKWWRQVMNLLRRAVVGGGAFVVNGPEHKGDGEEKTVIMPGGKRIQKKIKAKWLSRREIERDLNVVIHIDVGEDEVGETSWIAQVLIGRYPGFERGSKFDDLDCKHIFALTQGASP